MQMFPGIGQEVFVAANSAGQVCAVRFVRGANNDFGWLAVVVSIAVIAGVLSGRRFVAGLTLMASWRWAVAASATLLLSTLVSSSLVVVTPGWKSAAQYFSATMLLTPLVATLGARWPGNRAWQWFVVLPMIVVLQWPAATQLVSSQGREAIELGAPATTGVLLVVMMSAGTMVGTSMALSALMYIAAILCCLLPTSGWMESTSSIPLLSPLLLFAARIHAGFVLKRRCAAVQSAASLAASIDSAWKLFQNLYGLVWTRRVLDRVNQFALREEWIVMLTPEGFRSADGLTVRDEDLLKPLDAFRWVLSRFADHEWIERHLVPRTNDQ